MDPALFWQLVGFGIITLFALSLGAWLLLRLVTGKSMMREVAEATGVPSPSRSTIDGVIDGVRVRGRTEIAWLGNFRNGSSKVRRHVELEVFDPGPEGRFQFTKAGLLSGQLGPVERALGISMTGDLPDLLSRLAPATHAAIVEAVAAGWTYRSGRWTWSTTSQLVHTHEVLQALRQGVALARAFERDGSVAEGLSARFDDAVHPELRHRAAELRATVEPAPSDQELAKLLSRAGESRLAVAEALGLEDVLRQELTSEEDVAHRARAAVALASLGHADQVVRGALVDGVRTPRCRGDALRAIAEVGLIDDVPALRATGAYVDDAVAAIQARAEGAAVGQVSIADDRGGAVSIARPHVE